MPNIEYSEEHVRKLREFFGDSRINEKLGSIISDFPHSRTIIGFDKDRMGELHISVIKELIQDIYVR